VKDKEERRVVGQKEKGNSLSDGGWGGEWRRKNGKGLRGETKRKPKSGKSVELAEQRNAEPADERIHQERR